MSSWRAPAAIAALFLLLAALSVNAIIPQPDEAVYANPGYNLAYHGHLGTTIYELNEFMPASMARRTYWQPPLYFVLTAGWFRLIGYGLAQVRSLSVLFGLAGVISWYWVASKLSGSRGAGLVAMSLVGVDYFYLLSASTGRMDMVCGGLGAGALAAYLTVRGRSMGRALLLSHAFVTASILSHPAGFLYWLALVYLVLSLDRRKLGWRAVGSAAAPAVIGIALWGIYILPAPKDFGEQMMRVSEINLKSWPTEGLSSNPLVRSVQLEWRNRYVAPFGLGKGVGLANRLKALLLAAFVAAIAASLGLKRFRSQPGHVQMAVMTLIAMSYLALASPSKFSFYLLHVTGFAACGLGILLYRMGGQSTVGRVLAVAAFGAVAATDLAGDLYRIRQDELHRLFLPAARTLEAQSSAGELVMGVAEFHFFVPADRRFRYDPSLGLLTGEKPQWIIWGGTGRFVHESRRTADPARFALVQRLLDDSELVLSNAGFELYRTKQTSETVTAAERPKVF